MRKTLTLLFCAGLVVSASAQSYFSNTTIGTNAPYRHNSAGTEILSTPSNDVFSAAQTIPFAWNFYGTPVSSYLVSDNGYITFDTAASTSDPVNGSIPSTGGPNNAIYSFWDDLGLTNPTGIEIKYVHRNME